MEKIERMTPDITQENIERLMELFPSVATEVTDPDGKPQKAIDFDALRELLGDVAEGQRERYQFTWPGKREAKLLARTPCDKTMRPERDRSVNWDTTENLYIEGDNLEALKLMRETYAGKIKLIYIDPPYNTGHDMIYHDDFAVTRTDYESSSGEYDKEGGRLVANPESNGRFHSDWCSTIYPRLLLARDLLADDGVIFISIDDNEDTNMRKLCDEIFGADHFLAQAVWQKRTSPDMRKRFSTGHEYVLAYLKNASSVNEAIGLLPLSEADAANYKNPDNDPRGPWASSDFTAQGYRPNQMYEITTPSGAVYTPPAGTCWKNIESEYLAQAAEGRFWYGADGSGMPRRKTYLSEKEGKNSWTWWSNKEVGHTQEATKELKALFPDSTAVFDFPKPVRLLSRIVSIATRKDSLVLDFFSGSATMAQAVMQMNAIDGGNRRFILVQIPEEATGGYDTLCDVGEERIRRAGRKISDEIAAANKQLKLGEAAKELPDVGFRVLCIDSSNFRDTFAEPGDQSQATLYDFIDNLKDDRSPEDLLFQVLPSFRIPYSARIEEFEIDGVKCFNVNDGQLIACFDTEVGTSVIEKIAQERPIYAVFRDASLADDSAAANFEELFKTYSPDTIRRVI